MISLESILKEKRHFIEEMRINITLIITCSPKKESLRDVLVFVCSCGSARLVTGRTPCDQVLLCTSTGQDSTTKPLGVEPCDTLTDVCRNSLSCLRNAVAIRERCILTSHTAPDDSVQPV